MNSISKRPQAVIFDLDDTLSKSFQPLDAAMIARLSALIELVPVAIMTGAGFERIGTEVLDQLPRLPNNLKSNLSLFPNSSSQCYLYEHGAWVMHYSHVLSDGERARVKAALAECTQELDVIKGTRAYGEQVADREAQIAFTVVGLEAPQEVKQRWDPDGTKRHLIVDTLKSKLDGFDILIGGASTIDITRKDINKAYGVTWLSSHLAIRPEEMLYIGDALYEGGNDAVVIPTGVQTHRVAGPEETAVVIDELVELLKS